jgi:hypothetical protein
MCLSLSHVISSYHISVYDFSLYPLVNAPWPLFHPLSRRPRLPHSPPAGEIPFTTREEDGGSHANQQRRRRAQVQSKGGPVGCRGRSWGPPRRRAQSRSAGGSRGRGLDPLRWRAPARRLMLGSSWRRVVYLCWGAEGGVLAWCPSSQAPSYFSLARLNFGCAIEAAIYRTRDM